MSMIRFHSPSNLAGVSILGTERHHMIVLLRTLGGLLTNDRLPIAPTYESLNSCIRMKSDCLTLFVRIHAQCESHGWIEGKDRAWIASIISEGLDSGLFRQAMGWEELQQFLRQSKSEPVVMSFSGTLSFPNATMAEWDDEHEGKPWEELSPEAKWSSAMELLLREADSETYNEDAPLSRQLHPGMWHTYFFNY